MAFYDSEDTLQQVAGRYLREGLSLGERLFAVVSPGTRDLLRAALGSDAAGQVDWATDISFRDLGAVSHGYRRLFRERREAGTTVRLISEYHDDVHGTPNVDRVESWVRLDAAGNEVLSPFGHRWACLYDVRTLPGPLLDRVRRVHPAMLRADGPAVGNPDYLEPADYLAAHPERLPPVPGDTGVDLVLHTAEQLRDLRRALRDWIARLPVRARGVDPSHGGAVLLAVGEAATNALQHGHPPVRIRAWAVDDGVRVRVDGRSDGAIPATAGYWADGSTGIGLLLVRGIADTVRVVTEDGVAGVGLEFRPGS
ncbi:MEDS domain-containing protein [Pseudonocardia humida]|uniref:Sensor histidine kinase n=1 Tax=Pseudonocardia humida TaxID=2800819 RepID=A0ABT0ZV42_9PSEU|nr:MEDS domain-containing protein [Pseudonocardia humida]MCO1654606.1 sensor histidine kinase [Pseudonocardia humida]